MMDRKTMGEVISARRKELGLTQNDLAGKMGVTDKAVSKWERNLSCPDLASIPKLAEVLGISLEELLNVRSAKPGRNAEQSEFGWLLDLFLLAVPFVQGMAIMITTVADYYTFELEYPLFSKPGLGLICIALYLFRQRKKP